MSGMEIQASVHMDMLLPGGLGCGERPYPAAARRGQMAYLSPAKLRGVRSMSGLLKSSRKNQRSQVLRHGGTVCLITVV